jgi:AcrR family transcriptional regulator
MAADPAPDERPLRRDAERNRQRILDAAAVVFAERGLRGSHDDIAREAGVGVGTVYRRFPAKEQLIDALFEDRMNEMAAVADEARAMADPWEGLVHFMVAGQELQSADRGLKELMLSAEHGADRVARGRDRIAPIVQDVLTRAQQAGAVRDDIALTDLPLIQHALGAVTDATRDIAPDAWRRLLTIILEGLRPAPGTTRPMQTPPLTLDQLAPAMQAGAGHSRR